MTVLSVVRKHLISALRGEYLDFVVSRAFFAVLTVGASTVILHALPGGLLPSFGLYAGVDSYLGYIIVGTALYSFTRSIFLNVGRTLMTERREGTLDAVLLTPCPRLAYYGGSLLAQMLLVSIDFAALMFLAYLLNVPLHPRLVPLFLGLFLLFLALFGIAVLVSLVMIWLRDTFFVQNTLLPILLLLGGYLFPPAYLPGPLALLSRCLPTVAAVDLVRRGLLSSAPAAIAWPQYLLSLAGAVCLCLLGFMLLRPIERYALEEYLS